MLECDCEDIARFHVVTVARLGRRLAHCQNFLRSIAVLPKFPGPRLLSICDAMRVAVYCVD